ncbi:hypothetical protein U1Q18_007451 [Sarracenia purpurea var. burkii]
MGGRGSRKIRKRGRGGRKGCGAPHCYRRFPLPLATKVIGDGGTQIRGEEEGKEGGRGNKAKRARASVEAAEASLSFERIRNREKIGEWGVVVRGRSDREEEEEEREAAPLTATVVFRCCSPPKTSATEGHESEGKKKERKEEEVRLISSTVDSGEPPCRRG